MGKYLLFILCLSCTCYSWAQKKTVSKPKRKGAAVAIMAPPPPDEYFFCTVSSQAEYPGGNYAFQKYINEHLRYPAQGIEEVIEGTVTARFVVDENGKISRIDILRDIVGGFGKEVKRVLSSMDKTWNPYKYNNQSIPSVHMLEVKFHLINKP